MDNDIHTILRKGAVLAAPALLGWRLYKKERDGTLVGGTIIETEAYTADDAASHSFKGKSSRNAVMFEPAGAVYVYFTYGMHWCMNIVTGEDGVGEAVLIRALIADQGIEKIRQRRNFRKDAELTDGPAKVCQALAVTGKDNGAVISESDFVLLPPVHTISNIVVTPRIGIKKNIESPYRFLASFE